MVLLDQNATEQIGKAKRNSRSQGAGNRFSQEPWCELEVIKKQFPAYFSRINLTQRADVPAPEGATLLSMKEFIKDYTDNGVLYHGTKDIANPVSMLRGGLVMSNGEAGTGALHGAGFYTTKDFGIAAGYSDKEKGEVLTFKVNQDEKIGILDLNDKKIKLVIFRRAMIIRRAIIISTIF